MCFFRKWIVSVFDSFLSILLKIRCSRQSKINAKDAASPRGFVFYLPVTCIRRGVSTLDQSFFSLCIKQEYLLIKQSFVSKKKKKKKVYLYFLPTCLPLAKVHKTVSFLSKVHGMPMTEEIENKVNKSFTH